MAFNLGSIYATLQLRTDEFNRGLHEASNKLSLVRGSLEKLNSSLDQVRTTGNIALASLTAFGGFLGKLGLDQAAQNEVNQASFETLFKDSTKAYEFLKQVKQDAIDTPFDLQGLVNINQILIGAGLQAEKARDLVKEMGDVMAGMGKGSAEMVRMGNTISQVFGKGKADAIDFKELVNAGWVTVRTDVAETMGVSMEMFEEMVSSGKVGFDEISQTFKKVTSEGGRFFEAMKRQTNTFSGQMARLGDTINLSLGDVMSETGAFEALKQGLDFISSTIESNKGAITQFFKDLGDTLRDFVPKLVAMGNWIMENKDTLIAGIQGIAIAFGGLYVLSQITAVIVALANPINRIALVVALLYTAWQTNFLGIQEITQVAAEKIVWFFDGYIKPAIELFKLWLETYLAPAINNVWSKVLSPAIRAFADFFIKNWDKMRFALVVVWEVIKSVIIVAWSIVSGVINTGLSILSGDWSKAWNTIKSTFRTVWGEIEKLFNMAKDFVSRWGGEIFNKLKQPFEDAWNKIKEITDKIRGALDPNQRHSPSMVDLVNKGVADLNRAWSNLTVPIIEGQTMAGLATAGAGARGVSGVGGIHIDLRGSTIASEADALSYGEMIGDSIVKRLQQNVRF